MSALLPPAAPDPAPSSRCLTSSNSYLRLRPERGALSTRLSIESFLRSLRAPGAGAEELSSLSRVKVFFRRGGGRAAWELLPEVKKPD